MSKSMEYRPMQVYPGVDTTIRFAPGPWHLTVSNVAILIDYPISNVAILLDYPISNVAITQHELNFTLLGYLKIITVPLFGLVVIERVIEYIHTHGPHQTQLKYQGIINSRLHLITLNLNPFR